MKTSLKNAPKQKDQDDVEPVADEQALMEMGETGVDGSASVSLALGSVSGTVSAKDLIIPRLNIVQKVGPLSDIFDGGDLVINKETVLAKKETPINVTVLSIKKSYEEWIFPYDPTVRAKRYETLDELVADGKWIDWRNDQRPPAREVATVLLLIERPEDVDDLAFSQSIGGKDHALVMWVLRGTGYTYGAKQIFSKSSIELARSGLLSGKWELSTKVVQSGGNPVFAPIMRLVGKNDEQFIAEITERLS